MIDTCSFKGIFLIRVVAQVSAEISTGRCLWKGAGNPGGMLLQLGGDIPGVDKKIISHSDGVPGISECCNCQSYGEQASCSKVYLPSNICKHSRK